MKLSFFTSFFVRSILLLSQVSSIRATSGPSSHQDALSPCVARSPTTGLYFDLNAISISPPELKEGERARKNARHDSWHARGHDYGSNFTLNFCAPVVENVKDVVGVDRQRWRNVSAYYMKDGKTYSIGQQASEPFFRGRKLVLNYTNGSPCPGDSISTRTKSTMMSFLCDRDALASQAMVSFVGTMDSCSYFFEVRSSAACGIASGPNGGLGPGGVFGVIALIAVAAYFLGGCAYQRTVMHQRGWRQCPNYGLWAGILEFMKDMIVIIFSSLGRLFRVKRSGYVRADGSSGPGREQHGSFVNAIGRRRGRENRGGQADVEAENQLIDQLDEEWDD